MYIRDRERVNQRVKFCARHILEPEIRGDNSCFRLISDCDAFGMVSNENETCKDTFATSYFSKRIV